MPGMLYGDGRKKMIRKLFTIDYRSLAAFRIMMAVTLFYVSWILYPDLQAFFSNDGLLPLSDLEKFYPYHRITYFSFLSSAWLITLSWWLLQVFSLLLLVGYRSRLSAGVCLLLYLSFIGRNPMILQGGDVLLPLLLFWAVFLPVGKVFSFDGALDRERSLANESGHFSVASVGLLLQVLYVYVFGALLKTGIAWGGSATAVEMALHLGSFATESAVFLREYAFVASLLTLFVFHLELWSPLLLFWPDKNLKVRAVTLGLLMAMHVGFRLFLHIGHFWLASLSSLMSYIPSVVWDWISRNYWRERQKGICIYYDRDCGFCLKVCLLLREFFLPGVVAILPAQNTPHIGEVLERENSWVVVAPNGDIYLRWEALCFVTKQSIVMRPVWLVIWLLGRLKVGGLLYSVIGENRSSLGRITAYALPYKSSHVKMKRLTTGGVSVVVALCFAWNLEQHFPKEKRVFMEASVGEVFSKIGLSQRWNMFAPHPAMKDGYPVVRVELPEGKESYYLGGELVDDVVVSERFGFIFDSYRWRKYFNRIAFYPDEKKSVLFERYAAYMCRNLAEELGYVLSISIDFYENQSFAQEEDEYVKKGVGHWRCEDL